MNEPVVHKRMGRPLIIIDWSKFEALCRILCTEEEIAAVLDISVDTLERRIKKQYGGTFAETYKKYSSQGRASLRRTQFESAKKGNVAAQIWLGKQLLGQKEPGREAQVEAKTADGSSVKVTFSVVGTEQQLSV